MKLDDLLEQEYAPKAAAASAERARQAKAAAAKRQTQQRKPIASKSELEQSVNSLARALGARCK